MAMRPPVFRSQSQIQRTAAAKAAYDARREAESATRRLYHTARWRDLRRRQLSASPLCQKCEEAGRITVATVCDHVEPHRGDVDRFWSGPFQSLCKLCHDSTKQREERGRRG